MLAAAHQFLLFAFYFVLNIIEQSICPNDLGKELRSFKVAGCEWCQCVCVPATRRAVSVFRSCQLSLKERMRGVLVVMVERLKSFKMSKQAQVASCSAPAATKAAPATTAAAAAHLLPSTYP